MEKFNVEAVRFCEGCNVDICEACSFNALEHSRYGDLLDQNPPRFGRWAFADRQRFIKLLSEDVDPLKHGLYQANHVALPFIKAQNSSHYHQGFSPAEAKLLFIGNILHDAHEGLTGDVALPDKNLASDQKEKAVNLAVVAEILGPAATDEFMQAYENIIWDLEGRSYVGRAFKAIEVVGYVETGLRAWAARNHAALDDADRIRVGEMGQAVLELDTPMLTPFLGEFIYAAQVHERARHTLAEMKG